MFLLRAFLYSFILYSHVGPDGFSTNLKFFILFPKSNPTVNLAFYTVTFLAVKNKVLSVIFNKIHTNFLFESSMISI